jgi:hypothetical protein
MAETPDPVIDGANSNDEVESSTNSSRPGSSSQSTDVKIMMGYIKDGNHVQADDDRINALKVQREKMKKERKAVVKELKNENRKRQRLKGKARKLCTSDLVSVLGMRAKSAADALVREKAKAAGKSKGKGLVLPATTTSSGSATEV